MPDQPERTTSSSAATVLPGRDQREVILVAADRIDAYADRRARFCRRCKNDYSNRWYAKRRAAAKEAS